MPLVSAYQCEYSGKLFPVDQRDKYLKHRRKNRIEHFRLLKKAKMLQTRDKVLREARNSCESLVVVANYIKNYASLIQVNSDKKIEILSVEFGRIKEGESISNSHGSPIGKPTNWYGKDDLPSGYVGAYTTIFMALNAEAANFDSWCWKDSGIYFGSGGYNGSGRPSNKKEYRYALSIWYDDFPKLLEDYECRKTKRIMLSD